MLILRKLHRVFLLQRWRKILKCLSFGAVFLRTAVFPLHTTELQKSAIRGLQYLLHKKAPRDKVARLIMLHVLQRFGIELGQKRELIIAELKSSLLAKQLPFLRLIDQNYLASESEIKMVKGIDRITESALYCDLYPLPWDFYSELEKWVTKSGYFATHGLLAIAFLQEHGCEKNADRLVSVRQKLVQTVLQEAGSTIPITDLRIEAVLMLLLVGERQLVRPEWIAEIYLVQAPDGSFLASDHSTVLAAWALLEYIGAQKSRRIG